MKNFKIDDSKKADRDNRANRLNPNNNTYWTDRGYDNRPDDWKDRNS